MNRYQMCIVEAEKEKRRKQEAAQRWYENNWSIEWVEQILNHFGMIDNVSRQTEYKALKAVQDWAYVLTYTGEMTEFDDDMWRVYYADIELRLRWTNATIRPCEIGKEIGYTENRVVVTLRHLDNVMAAREKLNMRPLPPIPIRYLYLQKRVRKLAEAKGVKIAA